MTFYLRWIDYSLSVIGFILIPILGLFLTAGAIRFLKRSKL